MITWHCRTCGQDTPDRKIGPGLWKTCPSCRGSYFDVFPTGGKTRIGTIHPEFSPEVRFVPTVKKARKK
jgi:hypothetical protein